MARIIRLPMPEGGAERSITWETHHNCSQAKALRSEMGEDIDWIVFPVGLHLWEVGSNHPIPVTAMNDCGACGATLAAWFELVGPKLWTPGAAA